MGPDYAKSKIRRRIRCPKVSTRTFSENCTLKCSKITKQKARKLKSKLGTIWEPSHRQSHKKESNMASLVELTISQVISILILKLLVWLAALIALENRPPRVIWPKVKLGKMSRTKGLTRMIWHQSWVWDCHLRIQISTTYLCHLANSFQMLFWTPYKKLWRQSRPHQ